MSNLEFQSTLPQGERRIAESPLYRPYVISIHAPTRGATWIFFRILNIILISIHAPTRGATVFKFHHIRPNLFQSTLPQGERQLEEDSKLMSMLFQSTLPQGERHPKAYILSII